MLSADSNQLHLIRSGAARRVVTIHVVIDLIHVVEYIWKAAWSLHDAGDPAAEGWVAVKALAVLAGDSTRAAAGGRVHNEQMPRPALLLDVDGVLNPYGAVTCPAGFTEYDLFPGEEPVRLCRAHGEWISELRHVFDVAWATAWNDDANRLLAPLLGISALPVVTMPPPPFHPRDKIPPIARFAGQRPAAWIDDLHPAEARTWSTGRREPTLLIPVAPAAGLTRQAVDQALTWAKQT